MKKIKIIVLTLLVVWCSGFAWAQSNPCGTSCTRLGGSASEADFTLYDFNNAPNPETKAGYNLIFKDDFTGSDLDVNKWYASGTPGDDAGPNINPANVSVSGNTAHIKTNRIAYNNTTGPAFSNGEIKTFQNYVRPDGITDYRGYGFWPNSYIEVRAKMPNGKGVGSAGWLWQLEGAWHEVDMWETFGIEQPTAIQNAYHYTSGSVENNEESQKILMAGGRYIDQDYYIFGLEWNTDGYKLFINGKCVRDLKYADCPTCSLLYYPMNSHVCSNIWGTGTNHCPLPYSQMNGMESLRFGTGGILSESDNHTCQSSNPRFQNHIECEGTDLDKELKIDYVRVYSKQGAKAVQIKKAPTQICSSNPWLSQTSLAVYSYYPEAIYTWTSTSNALVFNDWGREENKAWLRCQILPRTSITGANQVLAVAGQTYPAKLTVTFPSGYQEVFDFNIQTSGSVPATPTVVPRAVLTNCRYPISVTGAAAPYYTAPYYTVYSSTPVNIGETIEPGESYNIKVCATNGCGVACQTTGKIVTAPNLLPGNCLQRTRDTTNQSTTFTATNDEPVASKTTTDWLIYPNPSEQGESLHIITNGNYLGTWLTITDVYGKTVSRTPIVSDQTNVPTENWHSGIYFIALCDDQNHYLSTKKLIVP